MKIYKLEQEKMRLGRKPKVPRMDQSIISKIGQGMYHCDGVKEVEMRVKFKNGTTLVYQRGEEEDEMEDFRINRSKDNGKESGCC
ncbi:MAG: hypothetical protein Q7R87_01510 [Nanoarchaeota archaeon]|nr:hypothetical protein [Nanoarchaeota archaeon]